MPQSVKCDFLSVGRKFSSINYFTEDALLILQNVIQKIQQNSNFTFHITFYRPSTSKTTIFYNVGFKDSGKLAEWESDLLRRKE